MAGERTLRRGGGQAGRLAAWAAPAMIFGPDDCDLITGIIAEKSAVRAAPVAKEHAA